MNSRDYDKLVIQTVEQVSPAVVSIVISKYLPRVRGGAASLFNPFQQFGDIEDGAKEKVRSVAAPVS